MDDLEVLAISGVLLSNRNRQNTLDSLKLQLKLENMPEKKIIIEAEILRIEMLLKKEQNQQTIIAGTLIATILLAIFIFVYLN